MWMLHSNPMPIPAPETKPAFYIAKLAQYPPYFFLLSWHCAVHNHKYVCIFLDYESSGLFLWPEVQAIN
jgi:hypothetical protein